MVELVDVSKRYGENKPVLAGVSAVVEAGRSVAVVGPSGSGKSTLLNLIGGLDVADSGNVVVRGIDIGQLKGQRLAEYRCRHVGFIFQMHHLLPQYTVLENVLIPTLAPQGKRDAAGSRARELLERVGLLDKADVRPGTLSGGECQRVAVVRALINQPDVLLADEPTGSLSRDSALELVDLLLQLGKSDKMTLITVTHSLEVAKRMQSTLQLRDAQLKPGLG